MLYFAGMQGLVLVVDDHPDVVAIIRSILEAQGYEVLAAYGGREAMTKLEGCRPDLVVLDIMMPEVSGFAVLKWMRATPRLASIPVILLTAKNEDEDLLEGYRCGADYYIPKPFTSGQLLYGIRVVLKQAR